MKLRQMFMYAGGLRSGWRLLIWLAMAVGLTFCIQFAVVKLFHPGEHPFLDPRWLGVDDVVLVIPVMIATLVMAHFERRPLRHLVHPGTRFSWTSTSGSGRAGASEQFRCLSA